jgi:hypothetical protein
MPDDTGIVSQSAINRLESNAQGQSESASTQLALTPYEYGSQPGSINPTAQDQHPAARRLASPKWEGYTGTLNRAQAAQDSSNVWVTVPVDKILVTGNKAAVAPVYASARGYRSRPGESTGSIPPTIGAGR